MSRTKGSKNKPKTVTADFATQIAEKQSAISRQAATRLAHDNKKAVRPASKTEIEELLKIQKEDKEDTQNEST